MMEENASSTNRKSINRNFNKILNNFSLKFHFLTVNISLSNSKWSLKHHFLTILLCFNRNIKNMKCSEVHGHVHVHGHVQRTLTFLLF